MEDQQIIDLFWERSENAIAAVAEKYGAYCRKIADNILSSHEDAEECVNDTYLSAWNSIPPDRPERLGAYLGRITRNLSLNRAKYYHTEKRGAGQRDLVLSELEDCIPAETSVEQEMDQRFLVEAIEGFLWKQPIQKRNIFVCRYWYLTPVKEIAKRYGMSESKITTLLFRMRKELKGYLEKEGIAI